MFSGSSTSTGTIRYSSRFAGQANAGFYRPCYGRTVSSIGIGTYLGKMDEATDKGYTEAVAAALRGGINFIDTSLNYRNQRSERNIGAALSGLFEAGTLARDEVMVCTKAGYLVPDAVPAGVLRREDVVGGMHSMAADFLADQLERSHANLGLETIDVFYLHNPETQLQSVPPDEFYNRVRQAFERLESFVSEGKIVAYGAATWDGFRKPGQLDLERMAAVASEVAGREHHFRFIQLPLNLAMTEALAEGVLMRAGKLGIAVIASASLLQARLASNLPAELVETLAPRTSDAVAALQFTRSAPGVAVALVGMSNPEHVSVNLGLSLTPPLTSEAFSRLFQKA